MVIRQAKKADQAEAISNARQVGIALLEFQQEYNSYPCASTQTTLLANITDSTWTPDATTANGLFLQLFVAGITESETMFYAKSPISKKPDGNTKTTKCLEAGEVGFGYILDGVKGQTAAGNPARVLCLAPMSATLTGKFDPDQYDKKGVILRVDNSVTAVTVNKDGIAMVNGADMLTASADSFWGTMTPTVISPIKKP
jgi:hypothetical protein